MSTVLQIDQMTLEEKLRAMEERESLIEEGTARFSDWETAKKRITQRTS